MLASQTNHILTSGNSVTGITFNGVLSVNILPARVGDEVFISLTNPDSSGATPRFEILDPNGQQIFFGNSGSTSFIAQTSGDYFITIIDDGSSASNRYEISASGFTGSASTEFIEIPIIVPEVQIRQLTEFQIEVFWYDESGTWNLENSNSLSPSSFSRTLDISGYPRSSANFFLRNRKGFFRLVR